MARSAPMPQSPFFRLPAELRDQIYEDVFLRGVTTVDSTRPTTPGLLLVSRQVNDEATMTFYRHTTFSFAEHWSPLTLPMFARKLAAWLRRIPFERRKQIRHITFLMCLPMKWFDRPHHPSEEDWVRSVEKRLSDAGTWLKSGILRCHIFNCC